MALDECGAGRVINCGSIQSVMKATLCQNTKLPVTDLTKTHGIVMVGGIVVGFDDSGTYTIPECADAIVWNDIWGSTEKTLIIKHNKAFFAQPSKFIVPLHITFDGTDHIDIDEFRNLRDMKIDFGPNMKEYIKKDGIIYTSDMKTLCLADMDIRGDVVIPNTVQEICMDAFLKCSEIHSVFIPDSVKRIGARAFASCTKMEKVYIGQSVSYIGNNCFSHNHRLKQIDIPGSVKNVEQNTISHCPKMEYIKFNEGTQTIGNMNLKQYQATFLALELPSTIEEFPVEYPATMLENLFALILHADSIQYVISDVMHHVMETTSYKRALSVGYFGKSDYAFSYSKEGAIRNGEILYIKTPSRAYVIPIDITYTNGMKVIKEIQEKGPDIPANLYQYCNKPEQKLPFAFIEYQTSQDEKTARYLKRNRKKLVKDLANAGLEQEIVAFLKWNILSKPMLKDVYEVLSETKMVTAKAYAMELLGSTKNRLTI